jgi:1,4-alpha-glucan branching enzyme
MRLRFCIALVAASLAAISSVSCATKGPAAPIVTPAGVRFTLLRPEASSITVAGSFNEWSTSAHPLARETSKGLWASVVALPAGEHLYMYVVDGTEWVSPPLAEDYVDDGFGSRNGVVMVRPSER